MKRHLLRPGVNRENRAGILDGKCIVRCDRSLGRSSPHGILGERHFRPRHAAPDVRRLWGDGLRRTREDGVFKWTADVQKAPHRTGQGTWGRLHSERFSEGVRIDARNLSGYAIFSAATGSRLQVLRPQFSRIPHLLQLLHVLFARCKIHVTRSSDRYRAVETLAAMKVHPSPFEHEINVRVRETVRAIPEMQVDAAAPNLPTEIWKLP